MMVIHQAQVVDLSAMVVKRTTALVHREVILGIVIRKVQAPIVVPVILHV